MLGNEDAFATVGVKDVMVSSRFYEDKLGLQKLESAEKKVLLFKSGSSRILVYESQYAGTNKATAVTWAVDNVDAEVKTLKDKGVVFEHYDFPGVTLEGDVHVMGKRRNAWFKDPDGNILSVVSR
jgi:extradiol dioxygenase family protein